MPLLGPLIIVQRFVLGWRRYPLGHRFLRRFVLLDFVDLLDRDETIESFPRGEVAGASKGASKGTSTRELVVETVDLVSMEDNPDGRLLISINHLS